MEEMYFIHRYSDILDKVLVDTSIIIACSLGKTYRIIKHVPSFKITIISVKWSSLQAS